MIKPLLKIFNIITNIQSPRLIQQVFTSDLASSKKNTYGIK